MTAAATDRKRLLIDCGNTRIKWALAADGEIVASGDIAHRGNEDEALDKLAGLVTAEIESVHVASVLDDAFTERLAGSLRGDGSLRVRRTKTVAHAHGLRIAYSDPEALGVDRWLAMIAARAAVDGPVCVASAGTAVTFDAVAENGSHLGGFIWAGPALAARALEVETKRIGRTGPASERPAGIDVLGRSTAEAVGRGSLFSIAAAIDRAVSIVAAETGEPALVLTGGDAGRVLPWLESRATIRPELVLEGLLTVADESG